MSFAQLVRHGQAVHLQVDGRPMLVLGGELHNSSGANLDDMRQSLARLKELHFNTVAVPVSWELVEPEEGRLDFSLVEGVIGAARRLDLRLVLVWFGTWKNGKSCYAPGWVKRDPVRFPRVQFAAGQNTDILSPFDSQVLAADTRVFAALCRRVGEIDQDHRVIMIQVENEIGILGAPRDFSPGANQAFGQAVPAELTDYLRAHRSELLPEVRGPWENAGAVAGRSWKDTFWTAADEFFMAWHMARFCQAVAAAGKAHLPVPMFVNAWLVQPGMLHAGQYPSGGPVSRVLDIYRAAAPAIDFLAPDIYTPDYKAVCASYARAGNPLFIAEIYTDARANLAALHAFGQHAAIGFAPFAVDDRAPDDLLGQVYATLEELTPLLIPAQAEGRVIGFYQQTEEEHSEAMLGGLKVIIRHAQPRSKMTMPDGGLLIQLSEEEFLAAGWNYHLAFATPDSAVPNLEMLAVDEGTVAGGVFTPLRRLNGDETFHGQVIPLWPRTAHHGSTNPRVMVCRATINRSLGPVQFQAEWGFPAG